MRRIAQILSRHRVAELAAVPVLFVVGCSPLPPDVDSSLYVPLTLAPAVLTGVRDERASFRQLFCAEGESEDAVGVGHQACDAALRRFRDEAPASRTVRPESIDHGAYRIAVALGVGWDCMRGLIDEAELPTTRLRDYGYDTQLLAVEGLSSSERNAAVIAEALRADPHDPRPFILIGYSKGTTDLLLTLQNNPDLTDRIAAIVTIAGAVGGSPVAERTSRATVWALRNSPFGDCDGGDGRVLESLYPAARHAWLADHLPLAVPSYSLITAPEPARVSRALRSSFKVLGAVHPLNDGALLHWDQLLPGSTLLGYVNADHWAVAVPLELDDIPLGKFLVNNGFPRTQLWRSIVDFVIADLGTDEPEEGFKTAYHEDMAGRKDALRAWPRVSSFRQGGTAMPSLDDRYEILTRRFVVPVAFAPGYEKALPDGT